MHDGRVIQTQFIGSGVDYNRSLIDWLPGYTSGCRAYLTSGNTNIPLTFMGAAYEFPHLTVSGMLWNQSELSLFKTGAFANLPAIQSTDRMYVFGGAGATLATYSLTSGNADKLYLTSTIGVGASGGINAKIWIVPTDCTGTWNAYWQVVNSGNTIPFSASGYHFYIDRSFLTDISGLNVNAASSGFKLTNYSWVDTNGFTSRNFPADTGGVTLYVSYTNGSNTNTFAQAQTTGSPLKNLSTAIAAIISSGYGGTGSRIKLLQGDISQEASSAGFTTSGRSFDQPLIVESYYHDYGNGSSTSGVRPLLFASGTADNGIIRIVAGAGTTHSNIIFRGLRFSGSGVQSTAGVFFLTRTTQHFCFDDCVFELFGVGLNLQPGANNNFHTFNRCIIKDCHDPGPHSQGIYADNLNGLLLSQCVFDRNGRKSTDFADTDVFSHNIYLDSFGGPSVAWGNFISRGGAAGIQMRTGGIVFKNVLTDNGDAGFISRCGGRMAYNYVEKGHNIDTGGARGFGFTLTGGSDDIPEHQPMRARIMELNTLANTQGDDTDLRSMILQSTTIYKGPDLAIRNNTAIKHGCLSISTFALPIDNAYLHRNFIDTSGQTVAGMAVVLGSTTGLLRTRSNFYRTSSSDVIDNNGDPQTLAQFQTASSKESDSIISPVPIYINSNADLGTWYASGLGVGGGTETSYRTLLRDRAMGVWGNNYEIWPAVQYLSRQYHPSNIPATGAEPLNFIGSTSGVDILEMSLQDEPEEPENRDFLRLVFAGKGIAIRLH